MAANTIAIGSVLTEISLAAAAPATFNTAGYDALTWKVVGELENVGDLGPSSEPIKRMPMSSNIVKKLKGIRDYGSLPVDVAYAPGDVGQAEMETAEASTLEWSFRLKFQDGTIWYFRGLVMGMTVKIGGANDYVRGTGDVGITTPITRKYTA